MDDESGGCRLCLDRFTEMYQSIDNPELKEQLAKVFDFSIDTQDGYPNTVCQSCCHTIFEFYQFSEKVRSNQEQLSVVICNKHEVESQPTIEEIKIEPIVQQECTTYEEITSETIVDSQESKEQDYESTDDSYQLSGGGESSSESHEEPAEALRKKRRAETQRIWRKRIKDEPSPKGKTKEELTEENNKIHEFYRMECDLCREPAPNFGSLDRHFRKKHGRAGYIVCCNRKITARCYLLQHMALHANPNAFRCEACTKVYKSKVSLTVHQLNAHGNEEDRVYKCDRCPQSFPRKYLLRAHLPYHDKVQCSRCDKMLANKACLDVHMINKHSDKDRRKICDTCGQEFLNKTSFDRHMKEHLGIEVVKKLQCNICQKWLTGERGLQQHLLWTHNYEKQQTHICDVCNKHYPNSNALGSHKRKVHVPEKFECDFCGAKFKHPRSLKEHRATHTGEVLYSCEICGVTKNSKSNLYVHVKNSHPSEWAEKRQKAAEAKVPKKQI